MKYKLMICIAIMLTIFLGVNVIAFANLENITTNSIRYENNKVKLRNPLLAKKNTVRGYKK